MATYITTADPYEENEIEILLSLVEKSDSVEELHAMCYLLSSSDWMFMPLVLASSLTKKFIQVSPDKETAKLLRGQWLLLLGMEYESEEEGIKLLQASKEGRQMLSQITAKPSSGNAD